MTAVPARWKPKTPPLTPLPAGQKLRGTLHETKKGRQTQPKEET